MFNAPDALSSQHNRFVAGLKGARHCMFGSWRRVLVCIAAICTVLYAVAFLVPRSVIFAYSGQTCRSELTLAPGLLKTGEDSQFAVDYRDNFRLGNLRLASTKTCFIPHSVPKAGTATVHNGLLGSVLFRTVYRVQVGVAPKVVASRAAVPLALTKPLQLQLSQPDQIHRYELRIQDSTQRCGAVDAELYCRFDKLAVEQGNTYDAVVERSGANTSPEQIAQVKVSILPAVHVLDSSVKPGETLFGKPTEFTMTLDKDVRGATTFLTQAEGASAIAVKHETKVSGKTITITLNEALPREKQFTLVLSSVEAVDGSELGEIYNVPFTTSGGPKVIGVNIGSGGVLPGTTVVVSFDQPLAPNMDVAQFATSTGGGKLLSYSGNQIRFSTSGVDYCGAFTLQIKQGLTGENGLVGKDAWSYESRMNCRAATRTIGYSVKGRPITAYYYGSGATTVLFTGGIHGNEKSGVYIMQDWVAYLDANAYKIPAGRQVVVVPSSSPDGFAANDRYNANGVNLDRNFPSSDWATEIATKEGTKPGGGGSAPLSEPEAQAMAQLTEGLRPRLVVSYHSSGSLVGINKAADSAAIGDVYAKSVGYATMYDNAEEIMGYSFTGEYETWIGEKLGAPAVLIELPTASGRYFSKHLDTLWKMVGV